MNPPLTPLEPGRRAYLPPAITGLTDLIDHPVAARPESRALIVGAERLPVSYRALGQMVDDVAAQLRSTGLVSGDRVGLISANNTEFVVGLLAASRAGLVVAPLDPALTRPEFSARLVELEARAILAGPGTVGTPEARVDAPVWSLLAETDHGTATLDTSSRMPPRNGRSTDEQSLQDALILFTAGTTADAKMVPLTHTNVAASVQALCGTYKLGLDDATVAVMPLFHGHGLIATLLASLATGGCVLLPERGRFSAHTFWDDLSAARATWFTAVPTIYEILLARATQEFPVGYVAPLRFMRSCSAPLNAATGRAMERLLGVPLLSAYGMTETTHQATSEPLPRDGVLKQGSVGTPTGPELGIRDENGHPLPAGREGEIWLRGPAVTRGYLRNPTETAQSFVDGWFRTGDLGLVDEDGYLFLTGRIKNLINRGGEKIAPEHIEDVLAGHPDVIEAVAYAVPDRTYGERVAAAVVVAKDSGVTAEQILGYGRDRLSAFEVPDRVDIVDALPHTAKGAINRRAVSVAFAGSRSGTIYSQGVTP